MSFPEQPRRPLLGNQDVVTDLVILVILWVAAAGLGNPLGNFSISDDWAYAIRDHHSRTISPCHFGNDIHREDLERGFVLLRNSTGSLQTESVVQGHGDSLLAPSPRLP
jgi:hypothetical protein